jgi:hypothetical protein
MSCSQEERSPGKLVMMAGLIAALMNIFLVLSLILQEESVVHSLVWVIVPVILLSYLFMPKNHHFQSVA